MIKYIKSAIVMMVILFSVVSVSAQWSEPTDNPPFGNVQPPINTGTVDQEKTGGLWIKTKLPSAGGGRSNLSVNGMINALGGFSSTNKSKIALDGTYPAFDNFVNQPSTIPWLLGVNGKVGATAYCNENGANCNDPDEIAGSGFMSKPYFNSGWHTMAKGETLPFNHNLNTEESFVYMEAKDTSGLRGTNIIGYGADFGTGSKGFVWSEKTANTIKLYRALDDNSASQVRVMMWKIRS